MAPATQTLRLAKIPGLPSLTPQFVTDVRMRNRLKNLQIAPIRVAFEKESGITSAWCLKRFEAGRWAGLTPLEWFSRSFDTVGEIRKGRNRRS